MTSVPATREVRVVGPDPGPRKARAVPAAFAAALLLAGCGGYSIPDRGAREAAPYQTIVRISPGGRPLAGYLVRVSYDPAVLRVVRVEGSERPFDLAYSDRAAYRTGSFLVAGVHGGREGPGAVVAVARIRFDPVDRSKPSGSPVTAEVVEAYGTDLGSLPDATAACDPPSVGAAP